MEVRGGAQSGNLEAPEADAAHWLVVCGSLSLLSYATRGYLPRAGPTHRLINQSNVGYAHINTKLIILTKTWFLPLFTSTGGHRQD